MDTLVKEIDNLGFSIYSEDELRKLSVKHISSPLVFDNLDLPVPNGLYDKALGPIDAHERCATCSLAYKHCPGHMGHIELQVPVYNPVLFGQLFRIFRMKCMFCHHFRTPHRMTYKYAVQFRLCAQGRLEDALKVDDIYNSIYYESAEDRKAEKESAKAKATNKRKKTTKAKKTKKKKKAQTKIKVASLSLEELGDWEDLQNIMNEESSSDDSDEAEEEEDVEKLRDPNYEGLSVVRDRECRRRLTELLEQPQYGSKSPTAHIIDFRRKLFAEFLSRAPPNQKCANCLAYNPRFKKDAHSRILELPLAPKKANENSRLSIERPNILASDGSTFSVLENSVASERFSNVDAWSSKNTNARGGGSGEKSQNATFVLDAGDEDSDIEELLGQEESMSLNDVEQPPEGSESNNRRRKSALQKDRKPRLLFPNVIERHMHVLWSKEQYVLEVLVATHDRLSTCRQHLVHDSRIFFYHVVPVIPNKFRPLTRFGDQQFVHPMNTNLASILENNITLARAVSGEELNGRKPNFNTIALSWLRLQDAVNCLFDNTTSTNRNPPMGVRQLLEKKTGMFRMFMMGKRVNYAARSVISPDPFIATNQIGVPNKFARTLTYPEPVSQHNVRLMATAVRNGPKVWPGANFVENENGMLTDLSRKSKMQRHALANTLLTSSSMSGRVKKVYRHLRDGDVVLMNRQPTLHKPSIMAHKVKVLTGDAQTFRMHYANCNTYNADFDGDEMNMHFPQDPLSRAEALEIATTDHQYVKPTDGSPLRGLIQDHVVAGVLLTKKDTFFTRAEFQQLVYGACSQSGERPSVFVTPPPAIWKPQQLWTGKQVFSFVLRAVTSDDVLVNYSGKSKIPASLWGLHEEEASVCVRRSELLSGVLDKSQFGASQFGIVHHVYEMYGAVAAGEMLSHLGRLFTLYLRSHGFTVGLVDMLVTPSADQRRRDIVGESVDTGYKATCEFAGVSNDSSVDDLCHTIEQKLNDAKVGEKMGVDLDNVVKGALTNITTSIIDVCLPNGQFRSFPLNCMSLMTLSGAKGSVVNFSQIACLLGQQELEGRRVPLMASGKSLPSFVPYDPQPRAGGFITQRFITGIKPPEYFFHCMAGREGLVDTAVKTSRSGYLQRCLVKHLESLSVSYDYTVRDVDGGVVQFLYGEDCIDVSKSAYLQQFDTYLDNFSLVGCGLSDDVISNLEPAKAVKKYWRSFEKSLKKGRKHKRDPLLSTMNPGVTPGVVSEAFYKRRLEFLKNADLHSAGISENDFSLVTDWKYQTSLVHPGESVGVLAAQSIGEPSTQMTLNTFHLAGHGGANVTLGIPRLREIIMTASDNIKTPIMELPVLGQGHRAYRSAERLRNRLRRLRLEDFLRCTSVEEHLTTNEREYRLILEFIPFTHTLMVDNNLDFSALRDAMFGSFFTLLGRRLKKELKNQSGKSPIQGVVVGRKRADRNNNTTGNASGNLNAEETKELTRKRETDGYDDPDDEDEAAILGMDEVDKAASSSSSDDEEEAQTDTQTKTKQPKKRKVETHKKSKVEANLESGSVDHNFNEYIPHIACEVVGGALKCTASIKISLSAGKILFASIVEEEISRSVIHQVPNISDCFVMDSGLTTHVQTSGVNLLHAWEHSDVVDINRIKTNDIAAVLKLYGVEACRAAIVEQVRSVFGVYGISVDHRHLGLVADYMTYCGGYRPLNRIGIAVNASPFQKMTFETSTKFLMESTLDGSVDSMESPSSRIVVGLPFGSGTGSFDLLQRL